jgi:hypothetical protein
MGTNHTHAGCLSTMSFAFHHLRTYFFLLGTYQRVASTSSIDFRSLPNATRTSSASNIFYLNSQLRPRTAQYLKFQNPASNFRHPPFEVGSSSSVATERYVSSLIPVSRSMFSPDAVAPNRSSSYNPICDENRPRHYFFFGLRPNPPPPSQCSGSTFRHPLGVRLHF